VDKERLDPTFLHLDERLDERIISYCFEASITQQPITLFVRIMCAFKVSEINIISNDTSKRVRVYYRICFLLLTSKQGGAIDE
jgi:hypothetical protein